MDADQTIRVGPGQANKWIVTLPVMAPLSAGCQRGEVRFIAFVIHFSLSVCFVLFTPAYVRRVRVYKATGCKSLARTKAANVLFVPRCNNPIRGGGGEKGEVRGGGEGGWGRV